ncbi:metallophosphoesterase [Macellibacteroides fermentans]|uniref:metallophosphoesterase n=1 Tax=Macellibacteroides fermentans TaxID=879969 RepID=UPI00406CBD3E
MKSNLLSLIIGLSFVCFDIEAQNRADQQHLENPNSFSMILLGDPQGYTKYDINQPLFDLCTAWIADNIKNLNIRAVLCTGDLVEQNENIVRNRRMVNQTSKEMWTAASNAFSRLDNKVPYIIAPGNHDYGYVSAENGMTHFPEYINFERNSAWRDICVSNIPNRTGISSLENAAFEFDEPNWGKILIITSEFAPRDTVLYWAKDLVAKPKYKNHKVFFITHSFLRERTAERTNNEKYAIYPRNWGQDIWEKLIEPSENINFVICGHTGKPGEFEDNVAYRKDKNQKGKTVHQMMFNVQTIGGGWEGNGGDGWLRILEFMPDGKTIKVRTYSPLFGISPSTKHLAHRTGEFDQFSIVLAD